MPTTHHENQYATKWYTGHQTCTGALEDLGIDGRIILK
jgi:hypothetical protein